MPKKYDRYKFVKNNITFFIYSNLDDLLRCHGTITGDSNSMQGYCGRTESNYSYSISEVYRILEDDGFWGFCINGSKIHIWIDKSKISFKEVLLELIGHEIAHTMEPIYIHKKKEEEKAVMYEDFITLAYEVTEKIMNRK